MATETPLSLYTFNRFFWAIIWKSNLMGNLVVIISKLLFNVRHYNHIDNISGLFDGYLNISMIN